MSSRIAKLTSSLTAAITGQTATSPPSKSLPNSTDSENLIPAPLNTTDKPMTTTKSDTTNDISSPRPSSCTSMRRHTTPPIQSLPRAALSRSNSIKVSIHRKHSLNSCTTSSSPVTAASYASHISSPAISFLSNIAESTHLNRPVPGVFHEGDQVHHYILEKEIGVGAFSRVHKARNLSTEGPSFVAIKILRKPHSNADAQFQQVQDALFHETKLWSHLMYPNILQMYQVMESEDAIFVVSELAQGSLFKFIQTHGPLKEVEAKRLFRQLVSAVKYMHQQGYVHRDIKCENILLAVREGSLPESPKEQDMQAFEMSLPTETLVQMKASMSKVNALDVKLADFGLSESIRKATDPKTPRFCVGTLQYCAPEEIKQEMTDLTLSDCWAMGCVVYAMLTGKLPFNDDFLPRLQYAIMHGKYDEETLNALKVSPEAQSLIKGILTVDLNARLTVDAILSHPWLH